MKLSTFVAIAAVIGGSFLIPNPAEARNGWMKVGCSSRTGQCVYTKVLNRNSYPYVSFMSNGKHMFKLEADCHGWRTRYINDNGSKDSWTDIMPQSLGDAEMQIVCR